MFRFITFIYESGPAITKRFYEINNVPRDFMVNKIGESIFIYPRATFQRDYIR